MYLKSLSRTSEIFVNIFILWKIFQVAITEFLIFQKLSLLLKCSFKCVSPKYQSTGDIAEKKKGEKFILQNTILCFGVKHFLFEVTKSGL